MLIDPTRQRPTKSSNGSSSLSLMPWSLAQSVVTHRARGLAPAASDRVLVMTLDGARVLVAIVDGA